MLVSSPCAALDPPGGDAAPGGEAALAAARGGDPVRGDALIEVLHRLQEQQGYLSRTALYRVAQQLQLPLSQVYGVASFYHLFRLRPPTPHQIGICLGSACFVRGAMVLAQQLAERLGVSLADPAGDGRWSLMPLGCLGACGQAPVLLVDGVLHTRLPLAAAAAGRLEQRLQAAGLPPDRVGPRAMPCGDPAERPGRAGSPGTGPAAALAPPAADPEAGAAGAGPAGAARLRSAADLEAGDQASRAGRCPAEPRPTPTAAPPTIAPPPPPLLPPSTPTAAPPTAAPAPAVQDS
ncbi:MAG: NAD(P)H-dependent oxidoreductase subunit E [Synechococcus sp.]|nr:NAD(P)H-dependent oxidoreductase subunit E [Synechococcus sp.]